MIDHAALLADLKGQVRVLEDDLRARSADVPEFAAELHDEWQKAHDAERIAAGYEQWLDGEITQAAVGWILGTVFLRFCEDNELIELPYLAGPGERLAIAAERQQAFFEQNPAKTDRDWIIAGFEALADASPVAAGLFDRAHNPMWRITPSHDAAKALLAFWRTRGEGENSPVVHDFSDPDWNTRFLGDLYQDLSEYAKKTYALLQTPEFVEEFILDLTLTPAIDEFGLEPDPPRARPDLPRRLRVIDPACGSGHFLLGAFARLLAKWEEQPAITDPWVLIRNVLDGLHGVDKNPFAVSIARFRLLIAAMKAGDVKHFADAPDFPLNIAVGDSLLQLVGARWRAAGPARGARRPWPGIQRRRRWRKPGSGWLAAAEHGGFLAITAKLAETAPVRDELVALADVSPVNVTEVFLAALREIVKERGKPRWESVLAADAADATPAAQAGFGGYSTQSGNGSTSTSAQCRVPSCCTTRRRWHATPAEPSCCPGWRQARARPTRRRTAYGCSARWTTRASPLCWTSRPWPPWEKTSSSWSAPSARPALRGGPHDRPRGAARRPQGPGPRPGGRSARAQR